MKQRRYQLNHVIKSTGRPKTTLLRWEAEGKISKGQRDEHGWRYYTREEFEAILAFAKSREGTQIKSDTPKIQPSVSQLLPPVTKIAALRDLATISEYQKLLKLKTPPQFVYAHRAYRGYILKSLLALVLSGTLLSQVGSIHFQNLSHEIATFSKEKLQPIAESIEKIEVGTVVSHGYLSAINAANRGNYFLQLAALPFSRLYEKIFGVSLIPEAREAVVIPQESRIKNQELSTETPKLDEKKQELGIKNQGTNTITREIVRETVRVIGTDEEVKKEVAILQSQFTTYDTRLNKVFAQLADISARPDLTPRVQSVTQMVALSQKIDNLRAITVSDGETISSGDLVLSHGNLTLTSGGITMTNGSLNVGSISSSGTLTVSASTGTSTISNNLIVGGTLTVNGTGTTTISGPLSVSGIFTANNGSLTISSTSTLQSQFTVTRAPSIPHAFATWASGVSNSNITDASLLINPTSVTADTNILGFAVNGSPKFIVDSEGDVFANSLTTAGTVTVGSTTASSFLVEGTLYAGDAQADTFVINAGTITYANFATSTLTNNRVNAWSLATSTSNTPILTVSTHSSTPGGSGAVGIGTTSPFAKLSLSGAGTGSGYAFAVSDVASTTRFVIQDNGNVGIGTTSPAQTLSVQGNALISGNLTVANITATGTSLTLSGLPVNSLLTTNASGVLTATSTPTFGNFNATSTTATSTLSTGGLTIGTSQFVVQQNSGNVGIGTTGPGAKLHVAGTALIGDSGISSLPSGIQVYLGATTARIEGRGSSDAIELVSTVSGSSNIQIGTVSGAGGAITTNATIGTNGSAYFGGTPPTGLAGYQLQGVNGGTAFDSPTIAANVLPSSGDAYGITLFNRTLSTAGINHLSWAFLNSSNVTKDYAEVMGGITSATAGSEQGYLAFQTINSGTIGERLRITAAGNVGIGTTSPGGLLSVSAAGATPAFLINQTSTGDLLAVQSSGTTNFRIASDGTTRIGTTTLSNLSIPRLAVVTGGPEHGLVVQDQYVNPGASVLFVDAPNITNDSNGTILLRVQANGTNYFQVAGGGESTFGGTPLGSTMLRVVGTTTSANDYALRVQATAGTDRFVVRNDGNVGIGTTSPATVLSVTPESSTASVLLGGTVGGQAIRLIAGTSGTGVAQVGSGYFAFWTNSDFTGNPANERIRITNGGLVGIGTTSPATTLSVQGNTLISGNLTVANITATGTSLTLSGLPVNSLLSTNASGVLTATSTPTFGNFNATSTTATSTLSTGGLAVGTSQFVVQQNSGNTGIGTTSPSAKESITGSGTGTGRGLVFADSNNAEKILIQDNGNVQIGSGASGSQTLTLNDGVATSRLFNVHGTAPAASNFSFGTYAYITASQATTMEGVSATDASTFTANAATTIADVADIVTGASQADTKSGTGTITNASSLLINQTQTIGTNNYAILSRSTAQSSFNGNVGVGTVSPGAKLESVNTSVGAVTTPLLLTNVGASNDGSGVGILFDAFDAAAVTPTGKIINVRDGGGQYSIRFSNFITPGNALLETMRISGTGNLGIGTTSPAQTLSVQGNALISGDITSVANLTATGTITHNAFAYTSLTASTEKNDVNLNLARTVQFTSGALATERAVLIQAPTYAFTASSTLTDASTLSITGAPKSGTFATTTNVYALKIANGAVTGAGITPTNAYGLFVDAPTGATNNYGAIFNTGNVGVGLTSPLFPLQVQTSGGTLIAVSDVSNYAGIQLNGGGAGSRNIQLVNGFPSTGQFTIRDSGVGKNLFLIDTTNNIGIGTTSPGALLSLAYNLFGFGQGFGAKASSTLPNASSTSLFLSGINLTYGSSSTTTIPQAVNAWSIATSSDVGSIPLLSIDSTNGRVGIGTTSPTAQLEVAGKARFYSDLNSSTYFEFQGEAADQRQQLIHMTSAGSFRVFSARGQTGSSEICLGAGTITTSNVGDTCTAVIGTTGSLFGGFAVGQRFVTNNSSQSIFGIGTPEVAATPSINNTSEAGVIHLLTYSATPASVTRAQMTFTARSLQFRVDSSGGVQNAGTEVLRVASTTNVGIGTTTPTGLLELASSSIPQLVLSDASATSNQWNFRSVGNFLYIATSSPSTYATSSVTALTINNNGNVGIGTTNPAGLLDVNSKFTVLSGGNIGLGTTSPGALLSVAQNGATSNASFLMSGINEIYASSSTSTIQNVVNALSFSTSTAARVTPILSIDGSGNTGKVGIGTSSPNSTFSVIGSGCISQGAGATIACPTTAGTLNFVAGGTANVDLAETYHVADPAIEAGDIVMLDTAHPLGVQKAEIGTSTPVIGIISTAPGFLLGGASPDFQDSSRPVALSGRVPVKVSLEGGHINIGDPIRLSSIPGIGMKAATSSETIGVALEPFDGATVNPDGSVSLSSEGKILVFVKLGHTTLDQGLSQLATAGSGGPTNAWAVDQTSGKVNVIYYGDLNVNGNTLLNVSKILSQSGLWRIDEDGRMVMKYIEAEHIKVEDLEVTSSAKFGTHEKPQGITLYDPQGNPYCLSVQIGGAVASVAGECGASVSSGSLPTPSSPAPSSNASTATTATTTIGTTVSTITASTTPSSSVTAASDALPASDASGEASSTSATSTPTL